MNRALRFAALAASLTLCAGVADARELRVAPASPPAHPAHYMYEHFVEYLAKESGGELTATILGPEVVALPQMKDALQTGLVDVGNYLPLYFAAGMDCDEHLRQLRPCRPQLPCDGAGDVRICRHLRTVPEGIRGRGSRLPRRGLLGSSTAPTTKPVRTADDLKGLRLRSGGAPYSRWAEHFGASGVAMGVGDTFEGMSQGSIDGSMASVVDMLSFRLIDVAKYVTRVPIGTYHVTSNFTVAKTTWDSLSEKEKAWLVAAAARANFDLTDRWAYQLPAAAMDAIKKTSIEVIEPDPAFLEASNAFIASDEAARVADGGEMAQHFVDLVAKWTTIVNEVGEDPDKLAERANAEIWSKVDWATSGK